MAVLCELGLHRPAPWPRWNVGYYFTRCERCGVDMVRTAYGSWQVPRGFRVRWQATPPDGAELQAGVAALERDSAPLPEQTEQAVAVEPPEEASQAPIGDAPEEVPQPAVEEPPATVEPPKARVASLIPDFMSEGSAQAAPPAPTGGNEPSAAAALAPAASHSPGEPEAPRTPWFSKPPQWRWPAIALPTGAGLRHAAPVIAFFLVVIVAALALTLVRWPSVRGAAATDTVAPSPASAEAAPAPASQRAFRVAVEASLLNCRASPAAHGEVLQRLARGETVQLIDRGAEWAYIDTERRQCWVLEQYLSAPLDL